MRLIAHNVAIRYNCHAMLKQEYVIEIAGCEGDRLHQNFLHTTIFNN